VGQSTSGYVKLFRETVTPFSTGDVCPTILGYTVRFLNFPGELLLNTRNISVQKVDLCGSIMQLYFYRCRPRFIKLSKRAREWYSDTRWQSRFPISDKLIIATGRYSRSSREVVRICFYILNHQILWIVAPIFWTNF